MAPDRRHEAADLEDYEVLDSSDTLAGPPGDDPLDRGVATPEHWSAGIRSGATAGETGESLDELLAEEEPDLSAESEGPAGGFPEPDENAPDEDVERDLREPGPDRRAGRLVTRDDAGGLAGDGEAVARDAGVNGGAATAEEAALHVRPEEENESGPGWQP